MDGLMKYWCTDCVIAGGLIYLALRGGYLGNTPEMLAVQIIGIQMVSKPLTHVAMAQMESLGLKTM